jgi:hypothetical protein
VRGRDGAARIGRREGENVALTQARLKEVLRYDPETGVFVWLAKRGCRAAGNKAGSLDPIGYLYIRVDGEIYGAHRLAWLYAHGVLPARMDHCNLVRSDNRLANLRPCTHAQNIRNARKHRDNRSGHKGVTLERKTGKWLARICVDYRILHLGTFVTAEEAAAAYDAAALRHHGEFARINGD